MKVTMEHLQRAYERSIWIAPRFPVSGGPFLAKLQDIQSEQLPSAIRALSETDVYADDSGEVQLYGGDRQSSASESMNLMDGKSGRSRKLGCAAKQGESGGRRLLKEIL